jgi:hypothetical protein
MQITMRSILSGIERTREIDVKPDQLAAWESGVLIQNAMPNLSDDDREFIMTGITPDEWENEFGEESSEES